MGHRRLVLVRLLVRLHVDGDDGVDGGVCGGRRAAPARGGSVASGPRTERMQPGAGCGDHLAARGGLARDIGVDCDFAPFLQNRDVQRSVYVDKVVVVADVMGPL